MKRGRTVETRHLGVRWPAKRDTALATRVRRTTLVRPPEILSEGGVALSLPAALQGAPRPLNCPHGTADFSHSLESQP